MRKLLQLIASIILVILFIGISVDYLNKADIKIKLNKIELQSTQLKLNLLQKQYKEINLQLDKAKNDKKKIKELEKRQKQLEEDKEKLKSDLQAKLNRENVLNNKTTQFVNTITDSSPVAASSGNPGITNSAKMFIYMKESGNNPGAINNSSGACGLGQALPCSKLPCSLSDYTCQDNWFTNYAMQRYGSWENAKTFWVNHRWW